VGEKPNGSGRQRQPQQAAHKQLNLESWLLASMHAQQHIHSRSTRPGEDKHSLAQLTIATIHKTTRRTPWFSHSYQHSTSKNQGDGSLKLKHLIKEEKGKQTGATQEKKGK
jgi:hypothetical protein